MSRFLFVVHPERPAGHEVAVEAAKHLIANGHEVATPGGSAFALRDAGLELDTVSGTSLGGGHGDIETTDAPAEREHRFDFVVALGGDGTMLHAVHLLDGSSAPVLAVNLGNLGYLTEIEPHELIGSLDRLLLGVEHGGWTIDERMMLDVTIEYADGQIGPTHRALNEVVVEKSEPGHTISLAVRIDGEQFTTYAADGMIVATPTGSTAYSMSARGPIVSPKHRAILVTPVAPHMLFDRTMVLDPTERVTLGLIGGRNAAVAVDGRPQLVLAPGSSVRCTPSTAAACFVRFGDVPYHQVLKTKFGLADR